MEPFRVSKFLLCAASLTLLLLWGCTLANAQVPTNIIGATYSGPTVIYLGGTEGIMWDVANSVFNGGLEVRITTPLLGAVVNFTGIRCNAAPTKCVTILISANVTNSTFLFKDLAASVQEPNSVSDYALTFRVAPRGAFSGGGIEVLNVTVSNTHGVLIDLQAGSLGFSNAVIKATNISLPTDAHNWWYNAFMIQSVTGPFINNTVVCQRIMCSRRPVVWSLTNHAASYINFTAMDVRSAVEGAVTITIVGSSLSNSSITVTNATSDSGFHAFAIGLQYGSFIGSCNVSATSNWAELSLAAKGFNFELYTNCWAEHNRLTVRGFRNSGFGISTLFNSTIYATVVTATDMKTPLTAVSVEAYYGNIRGLHMILRNLASTLQDGIFMMDVTEGQVADATFDFNGARTIDRVPTAQWRMLGTCMVSNISIYVTNFSSIHADGIATRWDSSPNTTIDRINVTIIGLAYRNSVLQLLTPGPSSRITLLMVNCSSGTGVALSGSGPGLLYQDTSSTVTIINFLAAYLYIEGRWEGRLNVTIRNSVIRQFLNKIQCGRRCFMAIDGLNSTSDMAILASLTGGSALNMTRLLTPRLVIAVTSDCPLPPASSHLNAQPSRALQPPPPSPSLIGVLSPHTSITSRTTRCFSSRIMSLPV